MDTGSLIDRLNACLISKADGDFGQTSVACPRDLLLAVLQALQHRMQDQHLEIVKPSAWATRERELIKTIEMLKSQVQELQSRSSSEQAIPSAALLESERLVRKLTKERDELQSKVQQLITTSKHSTRHQRPAASQLPSANAAAADQAAQSSGLVVVEHLSVSRSRQLLQQRVDESKVQADKALRMSSSSGGGSGVGARSLPLSKGASIQKEETGAEIETASSLPEKTPDVIEEEFNEVEIEEERALEEVVEEEEKEEELDETEQAREGSSAADDEAVNTEEEDEESVLDAAMKALVVAAEAQRKLMEEEEAREREREMERERSRRTHDEEAAARTAQETEPPPSTSAPPLIATEGISKEEKAEEALRHQVREMAEKVKVYEATLQAMRVTVEEADDERHLLREQNLQMASTLAEMQAFISHRARDKKSANVSLGSWLKKKEKMQLPVSSQPKTEAGARSH